MRVGGSVGARTNGFSRILEDEGWVRTKNGNRAWVDPVCLSLVVVYVVLFFCTRVVALLPPLEVVAVCVRGGIAAGGSGKRAGVKVKDRKGRSACNFCVVGAWWTGRQGPRVVP